LAPFCSAALRPLEEAYRSVAVLLEMVAVVGLVEFELPPVDVGVTLDRIKRAPSGLSGVFTLSFVIPENKNLHLHYYLQMGRVSSVVIATDYGLDCPRIESRWRRDVPHASTPVL
jgi:hypothetical protein